MKVSTLRLPFSFYFFNMFTLGRLRVCGTKKARDVSYVQVKEKEETLA